jgi:sugar-phosphatase
VINGKPDPEPYLVAAARMGAAVSDCVVIGDSPAGISSARAAGMRTLAVATPQAFGGLATADFIASSLEQIHVVENSDRRQIIAIKR